MQLLVPLWVIPAVLTIVVWLFAFLWPIKSSGGAYDFTGSILAVWHMLLGLIATLVIWLVFFIIV